MKKIPLFQKAFLMGILAVFACQLSAQTIINLPQNGAGANQTIDPPATCFFNFYDNGGAANNYTINVNASVTFLPSNAATHRVRIDFQTFNVEDQFDALYVFNSNTAGVNQVIGPDPATISGFPAGNWSATAPGTITANTGIASVGVNAAEALTIGFRSDGSVTAAGWWAIVNQVSKEVCNMDAAPDITNAVSQSNTCNADIVTAAPTFSPGGCNVDYTLRYRINGGAPVVVGNVIPANITLDDVPVGNNIITWELIDLCGGAVVSSDNQIVVVKDQTKPTITCPTNTTINLQPGECTAGFNYNALCSDNCPLSASSTVTHPFDFNNSQAGLMFDLTNLSSGLLSVNQFAPSLIPGTWEIEVYYTTNTGSWATYANNPGAWTLAGRQFVTSTGSAAGTVLPGFGISLPAGATRGIYITSTFGTPVNYTNGTRQVSDNILRVSSNPGAGRAYPFGTTFNNRSYNGSVSYTSTLGGTAELVAGLPSGSQFPIGTTVNTLRCTDLAGNSTDCVFSVTVNEYNGPTGSLACNDVITIALGPGCTAELTADQILEGGPYSCYDDYIVELDKTPPFNNGPWIINTTLTSADLGKTYGVRVTDPSDGNRCEGNVTIEDNLPAQLVCTSLDLPCGINTSPTASQNIALTRTFTPTTSLPQTVNDFQSVELLIPVVAPAGATVNDVNFRVRVNGDAFEGNLRIVLESPSGNIVTMWNQGTGCPGSSLFVRFDDEGGNIVNCPSYTNDQSSIIPFGSDLMSDFDGEPANGTWKVRVADINGFVDVSTVVLAELFVNVQGNFSTGFPNGLQYPGQVTQTSPNQFVVANPLLDDCSDVILSYSDQTTNFTCQANSIFSSIIIRTWTAEDESGNISTCAQQIRLFRPSLADVVLPPSYDDIDEPSFNCGGQYPTPAWIELQGLQGQPNVFGLNSGCNVSWTFIDAVIEGCDGTYTINRRWTLVDVCASQTQTYDQIIRVRDESGPVIQCPANIVVSTNLYECCGTVNLPDVIITDGCSQINNLEARVTVLNPNNGNVIGNYTIPGTLGTFPGNNTNDPDTLGILGNTPCLPNGVHIVTYTAQDDCGNSSTCSFTLTVTDYTEPAAACDEFTVVSIGADDPSDCYEPNDGCQFGGVTVVNAETFDDGSYDNCGAVAFTVRRKAPYSDCILGLNQTNGGQPCNDQFPDTNSEFDIAISEGDAIKFYCCEVGTTQTIILRVYQLDAFGDISIGPDGGPIYNECEIEVEVQDNLKPGCIPPANVTVSCENFDPSLWSHGMPTVLDNCCLDSTYSFMGQKGLTHTANFNNFDTVCNKGTIVRTFRVYDCQGFSSMCTQRVVVNYEQDYFIKFPNDKLLISCDSSSFDQPTFFGEDCELLAVSYHDEIFTVVPDACAKIERTWTVINWCTYDPNSDCIYVPNPNSNPNHSSNLQGPTVSPAGTPSPWAPTVVKINANDPSATNFSTYWEANANCYKYKQIIKVQDNIAPTFVNCPASPVEICDVTENDPLLWNETYWNDPIHSMSDLCEAPTDLSITGTDACSGANVSISYLLFLDLDNNGSMETVINSVNLPPANTVYYNNASTPNFSGGVPRAFDERAVAANQKYRFALQSVANGNSRTASLRWNTNASPNNYVVPELPYGTHKIKWILADGCGNEKVCEYNFTIKDCKPPNVTCLNGLSTNITNMGMREMFVADFILDAFDNCTPDNQLLLAIRRSNTGTGFPTNPDGSPQTSVVFTCDDLGTQPVEIWAQDVAGNAGFCETYVIIQDNGNFCSQNSAMVAGALITEEQDGLEGGSVEITGASNAGPAFSYYDISNNTGQYDFNSIPLFSDYTVTPIKDDNHLNGVSTYDLVLINKHILGIEPFASPYKMIAADANNSKSITTYDIAELRKLILGINNELNNNTSWRFVDKNYNFSNPSNPFSPAFPESKSVAALQSNAMEDDFVGIKVGDVNNSAIANSLQSIEDRTYGTLFIDIDDREVRAGEMLEVTFTSSEANTTGYQFTLNFPQMEVYEVMPGRNMSADNFAAFTDVHAITASVDGDARTFTVKFRANAKGKLSEMLRLSGSITTAEAYDETGERLNLAFRFNDAQGNSIVSGLGFELYQNQPNPFIDKTTIGFHLPEDIEATLKVYDETGRLLLVQQDDFPKGNNAFVLDRALLPIGGVLYYTLETSTDKATRKMIQMK
ncbi:MAG: HYR domain-containing protein [Saprospiraceae bacterium]|nr:HYR domain-containing protein [Saprospiraceae bacterium]